jgi:hypothetical protein
MGASGVCAYTPGCETICITWDCSSQNCR